MRHLFLIHSHITYLVARRVVDREQLAPRRIVLLCVRGYRPPESRFRIFDLVLYQDAPKQGAKRKRLTRGRRWLREIDQLVERAAGGERFHFYTPHTYHRYMSAVASHASCAGFSFIEEGLASYFSRAEINAMHPPRRSILAGLTGYGTRVGDREFFAPGHVKAYGLNSCAFPDLGGRVVLQDVFQDWPIDSVAEIENVLILDSESVAGNIRLETALSALDRALGVLAREGIKSLHYKFHPKQLDSDEPEHFEALFARHEAKIRTQRLGEEVIPECIAHAASRISFFLNVSSVGLYTALAGCRTRSFAKYVLEAEPQFRKILDSLPQLYHERVELLD